MVFSGNDSTWISAELLDSWSGWKGKWWIYCTWCKELGIFRWFIWRQEALRSPQEVDGTEGGHQEEEQEQEVSSSLCSSCVHLAASVSVLPDGWNTWQKKWRNHFDGNIFSGIYQSGWWCAISGGFTPFSRLFQRLRTSQFRPNEHSQRPLSNLFFFLPYAHTHMHPYIHT